MTAPVLVRTLILPQTLGHGILQLVSTIPAGILCFLHLGCKNIEENRPYVVFVGHFFVIGTSTIGFGFHGVQHRSKPCVTGS